MQLESGLYQSIKVKSSFYALVLRTKQHHLVLVQINHIEKYNKLFQYHKNISDVLKERGEYFVQFTCYRMSLRDMWVRCFLFSATKSSSSCLFFSVL